MIWAVITPVSFQSDEEDLVQWCMRNLLDRGFELASDLSRAGQFRALHLPTGETLLEWVEAESRAGRPPKDHPSETRALVRATA